MGFSGSGGSEHIEAIATRSAMAMITHPLENAEVHPAHNPDYSIRAFLIPLLRGFRRLMYAGFSSSKRTTVKFLSHALSLLLSTIIWESTCSSTHGPTVGALCRSLRASPCIISRPCRLSVSPRTQCLLYWLSSAERGHGLVL